MRPGTPGSQDPEIHGRGTDGAGGSGYADRPTRLWATTCRFSDWLPLARLGVRHRNGGLLNVIEDVDDDIDV
jgi:hypothetical protein